MKIIQKTIEENGLRDIGEEEIGEYFGLMVIGEKLK